MPGPGPQRPPSWNVLGDVVGRVGDIAGRAAGGSLTEEARRLRSDNRRVATPPATQGESAFWVAGGTATCPPGFGSISTEERPGDIRPVSGVWPAGPCIVQHDIDISAPLDTPPDSDGTWSAGFFPYSDHLLNRTLHVGRDMFSDPPDWRMQGRWTSIWWIEDDLPLDSGLMGSISAGNGLGVEVELKWVRVMATLSRSDIVRINA